MTIPSYKLVFWVEHKVDTGHLILGMKASCANGCRYFGSDRRTRVHEMEMVGL
jgi:hypothetical protein